MFYEISAWNCQSLYVWASDKNDLKKYLDYLNDNRDINHYGYKTIPTKDWKDYESRGDILNCDESYWDDFMSDENNFSEISHFA